MHFCVQIFLYLDFFVNLQRNYVTMTKDELISRLKDIEWDDFEVKEAARSPQ